MKTQMSFWKALDTIKKTAENGLWRGNADALMELVVGKARISGDYKQWLRDELLTDETAFILRRRGVDYHFDGNEVRFALQPKDKPAVAFTKFVRGIPR